MCLDIRIKCNCGKNYVPFNLRDNVLPEEVIENLYCPEKSKNIEFNNESMINDNGWIIEYNMELAKFICSKKLDIEDEFITPEFLFDEGYATWKEVFPGEQKISKKDREEIMNLAKTNPQEYFKKFSKWANERMEKFKSMGWRKAQSC
jgi:activator of 2-hydroxyglutaryl-CoA dehydratase